MNNDISVDRLSLSVRWASCMMQTSILQDSGSEYLKTVATSSTLRLLDLPIETLSISSSVAMREVVEDRVSIPLYCQSKGDKSIKHFWRDLRKPREVTLQGVFFGGCLINGVEAFLKTVCKLQARKVLEPSIQDQGFPLGEIMGASEQDEAIMHEGSSLLLCQGFPNILTDCFQTGRKKLQHMKRLSCTYCGTRLPQDEMAAFFFNLDQGEMNYWCGCPRSEDETTLPLQITDENLERWWRNFGDVPVDDEECIEVNVVLLGRARWYAGTDREDTWHWFDEHHSQGLGFIMYGKKEEGDDETPA